MIAGGGGAMPRRTSSCPRSLFASNKNGFAVIEGTSKTLSVTFVNDDLKPLHQFTLGN